METQQTQSTMRQNKKGNREDQLLDNDSDIDFDTSFDSYFNDSSFNKYMDHIHSWSMELDTEPNIQLTPLRTRKIKKRRPTPWKRLSTDNRALYYHLQNVETE